MVLGSVLGEALCDLKGPPDGIVRFWMAELHTTAQHVGSYLAGVPVLRLRAHYRRLCRYSRRAVPIHPQA